MKHIVVPFFKTLTAAGVAVLLAPVTGGLSVGAAAAGAIATYNGVKCVGNIGREIIGEELNEIYVVYYNFGDGALKLAGAVVNSIPDNPITDLVGYFKGLKFSHAIFRLVQEDSDFVIELTSNVYKKNEAEELSKKYGVGSCGAGSDSLGRWIYLYWYRVKGSKHKDNAISKVCYGKKRSSVSIADIKREATKIFENQKYDWTDNNCQDLAIKLAKWAN